MASAKLTDLPPELLDHITAYLPTASTLAALSSTSKSLRAYVEKDAWQTFNRNRFPSLLPRDPQRPRDVARTLTTLSKAYDRRAFVARYLEPSRNIIAYPTATKLEKWKRPRGQTIGFTPQLDVAEHIGSCWQDRTEVLAFSAGAELCIREKRCNRAGEDIRWLTYRPLTAFEGRDDIITLHLISNTDDSKYHVITGTANGDLQLLRMPPEGESSVPVSYFTTQGLPIRSSSVLRREDEHDLLVASMGDSHLAVYNVDPLAPKSAPLTQIDTRESVTTAGTNKLARIWTTKFLSSSTIALGLGPSSTPIQLHQLDTAGLSPTPLRSLALHNDMDSTVDLTSRGDVRKSLSSVYPIETLPSSSIGGHGKDVFLSGAYDGIIRLHDLRSNRDFEHCYVDPTDDSPIYSLLPRGHESVIAGSSRQSRLKFFDLRLGAKCYSHLDAWSGHTTPHGRDRASKDWNLFVRQTGGANWGPSRRQHWQQARAAESSIYSLASPSSHSPFVYAGLENAITELAFTAILDDHPDATFFAPWQPPNPSKPKQNDTWSGREFLDLAMVDQTADMKLHTQKTLVETWRHQQSPLAHTGEFPKTECLDERWKVGS